MHSGIKNNIVPREGLQAAAELVVFLNNANTEAFFAENVPANQASEATSYDNYIVIRHF